MKNKIEFRDAEKNFHGNRVVYLHWEQHLSICAALAFPLPPDMPFAAFIEAIVKPHYNFHPDFDNIDWSTSGVDDRRQEGQARPVEVAGGKRLAAQVAGALLDARPRWLQGLRELERPRPQQQEKERHVRASVDD